MFSYDLVVFCYLGYRREQENCYAIEVHGGVISTKRLTIDGCGKEKLIRTDANESVHLLVCVRMCVYIYIRDREYERRSQRAEEICFL